MLIIDNQSTVLPQPCVASIGFFDGVHRGHIYLIDQVKRVAIQRGLKSALLTFPVSPTQVIFPERKIPLLAPIDEKLNLLRHTEIDYCFLVEFTLGLSKLTAKEFMEQILLDKFNVKVLIIGYDHRFGYHRSEGFEDYCRYGRELGIDIVQAEALPADSVDVSSSLIRNYIQQGEIELVEPILGYSYSLRGTVIKGKQLGRTIGFPTANIRVDHSEKIVPKDGVYAVQVILDGDDKLYWGMLNIGNRPTVDDFAMRSIEVNILGFKGDIYDQQMTLLFKKRLRDEVKFASLDALVEQLRIDRLAVEKLSQAD
jgi:riboflavin kinase / FMN adenylyltransferase